MSSSSASLAPSSASVGVRRDSSVVLGRPVWRSIDVGPFNQWPLMSAVGGGGGEGCCLTLVTSCHYWEWSPSRLAPPIAPQLELGAPAHQLLHKRLTTASVLDVKRSYVYVKSGHLWE